MNDSLNERFYKRLTKDNGVNLGDLSGNRFKIVIRDVKEKSDELIRSAIDSLKSNGFINYFGLQRFGNSAESPTHLIGK